MLGLTKRKPVEEYEARGEIGRVYHEIKQVLRVSGVNLNFRIWASYERFFPAMWDALRPSLETRTFENAADELRRRAVECASRLGRLDAAPQASLGESQAYQVRAALNLYHYINPKLAVLTSAVALALEGYLRSQDEPPPERTERIERGIPPRMYPMEMVSEKPADRRLRAAFDELKRTFSLSFINSDYRTLALWPEYLLASWERLRPLTRQEEYRRFASDLRELARSLARPLPYPVSLSRERVRELGEDPDEIARTTARLERQLPPLLLNVALFQLDWRPPDELVRSPFPAGPRRAPVPGEQEGPARPVRTEVREEVPV